jgi:uncharacterized protein (DUF4415 family)
MNKERIIRYTRENLPQDTRTNWRRLRTMTEDEIEAAARADPDAQPFDAEFFKRAKIVTPPPKKSIHLRVDSDVLEWFKDQGKGYQTRMNAVLRAYMEASKASSV